MAIYLWNIKGLAPSEIGLIFACGQLSVLFLPVAMTLLADRYRLVSSILTALFVINLIAMSGLTVATGFAGCLVFVFLNQFANQPQVALADGLFFSLQSDPTVPRQPFTHVRVWGTIGFIVPSVIIFIAYRMGGLQIVPYVATLSAALGLINAQGLPRRLPPAKTPVTRLPTVEAARVFRRPAVAVFCLGLGCLYAANAAYYGFYPLYLTQQLGVDARWIGLIANLGVALEILYMLSFERLRARFGLPAIILAGAGAVVARMTLLGFVPARSAAIGLQAMHGLTVIGVFVAPLMHLNSLVKTEGFRNSVQGLYVMLVAGLFSIAGNYLAGKLAEQGLLILYRGALASALLGGGLIWLGLRATDRPHAP